jgi:opacity protein-like surface antigen
MKKYLFLLICAIFFALPAHSDSFFIMGSYFTPDGKSDVFRQNIRETVFKVDDLNDFGGTFGYNHFIGNYVDVGGSLAYYRTVETVQDRITPNGRPVVRDIRFKIVPLEANISVLPVGRNLAVIPYVGAGVGVYFWEYEEIGDFVIDRFTDPRVITGSAFSDGTDFGWNIHGGIQIPFSRSAAFMSQIKYSKADGKLDRSGFDPAFDRIDLSMVTYSVGVSLWF